VIRLPAHAPALDPAEQGWSHVKRGWGNLIVRSIDQPVAVVKNRLKRIRCRPETAGEELHDRRPADYVSGALQCDGKIDCGTPTR